MTSEAIPPEARPRLSRRARVQTDKVTGKPVLLYPEGVLLLNPTGHEIVKLCSGDATFEEIVTSLAGRYNLPAPKIAAEVSEYLERLRARNLLDLLPQPSDGGEDRRTA
ncbi:Coenzyme PQQ biosynthesis protein PqqD [Verrucomicrobia bacterium]|nr:Coenzyme PQQ biosynthesis protein PqqD [Verrucomicrobiota bacterium]